MRSLASAELRFNDVGQLDGAFEDDLFSLPARPLAPGPSISPRMERRHLIGVTAHRTVFDFGRGLHRPETIEALAAGFRAALREIIDHCAHVASPERTASANEASTPRRLAR